MKVSQNNQRLQKTKYLGSNAKNRVELEDKQRVHRRFSATSNRETSEFEYGSLERILSRENLLLAMKRVISNKGSHGVDGMTVYELRQFLKDNWLSIKESILNNEYKPMPVRRVEIPKPNGGTRLPLFTSISQTLSFMLMVLKILLRLLKILLQQLSVIS